MALPPPTCAEMGAFYPVLGWLELSAELGYTTRRREKIVLTTSRIAVVRGRPPGLAAGMHGAPMIHAASVRSVAERCTLLGPPPSSPQRAALLPHQALFRQAFTLEEGLAARRPLCMCPAGHAPNRTCKGCGRIIDQINRLISRFEPWKQTFPPQMIQVLLPTTPMPCTTSPLTGCWAIPRLCAQTARGTREGRAATLAWSDAAP